MLFLTTSLVLFLINLSDSRAIDESKTAKILKHGSEFDGIGKYNFFYETSNGIQREETGEVLHPEADISPLIVHGSYSYTGSDGEVYVVQYVADENGFQPKIIKSNHDHPESQYQPTETPELPTTTKPIIVPIIASNAIKSVAGNDK